MTRPRPYRPFSSRPHTYGVRVCSCAAFSTEPCRPTACVREWPCPHNGQGGLGETSSYRASAPIGAVDIHRTQTATAPYSTFYILHSSLSYTFSAKEKDSETGLSYFGSRYYSSDLSIWLSVDPQSDKYAYQSGYVYCGNNPLKVIDPNGEDEWEVNEITGQVQHYSNDNPDRLYVTTAYGQRKDDVAPLDVDRSVMQQMLSEETETAFISLDKRNEMNQLFDYLADNTYVEWTHVGVSYIIDNKEGGKTITSDMIFTRHQFTSCNMRGTLTDHAANGTLDFHKHSHPNKYMGLNPYYRMIYPTTSHMPSRPDYENKNSYPIRGVPFKQPYFLLRNGKRNIYY